LLKNVVPALRAISGYISQCPNCLLTNIQDRRGEKVDKLWDSLGADDNLSMLRSSRRNVGKCPSSFELRKKTNFNGIVYQRI
jgi:hypothetical protein